MNNDQLPYELQQKYKYTNPGQPDHERLGQNEKVIQYYIWHQYYKPKWDSFETGQLGLALAQINNESKDLAEKTNNSRSKPVNATDEYEKMLSEIDMGVNLIRSNRYKMGFINANQFQEVNSIRDSSLMSMVWGWMHSVEMPVEQIEKNENEQIIEASLKKISQKHHYENYLRL